MVSNRTDAYVRGGAHDDEQAAAGFPAQALSSLQAVRELYAAPRCVSTNCSLHSIAGVKTDAAVTYIDSIARIADKSSYKLRRAL
jgi:hypothetical protein